MNILFKMILTLTILISLSTVGSASLHNVSGYIYVSGTGLSGVTVTDNESIDTTISNATGYYFLAGYTNQTSYVLTATKSGYTSNILDIDFLNADLINKNITIVKQSMLYSLWDMINQVTSQINTILNLIILGIMISCVYAIGTFITNTVKKGTKK